MTWALVAWLAGCGGAGGTATGTPTGTGSGTTGTTASTAVACDDGLPPVPFDDGAADADWDAVVPDFEVDTDAGPWRLSEHWTGCDSYVFVSYYAPEPYASDWADGRQLQEMLELSPPGVHWFFGSYETASDAIDADLAVVRAALDDALSRLDPDLADHWAPRLHLLSRSFRKLGEPLTTFVSTWYPWDFSIDRLQRLREVGYYADPLTGWSTVEAGYLAYEPQYHDFDRARDAALAAEDATVVRLFDAEPIDDSGWSGQRGSATVTLPDAATMATFRRLELDLTLDCPHPELGSCPAWDYLVELYLCDEGQASGCETEIGRWVTTYWRRGRWVVDATFALPLLASGGERTFEFYTTQPYDVTLDLRLVRGEGPAPFHTEFLWSGGTFDATYNDAHPDLQVEVPADATRAELYVVVSGHGYSSDPDYCGEFCNHQHEFTVDGTTWLLEPGTVDDLIGCANQVATRGVIPNQAGTWVYGRGGWCPGLEVAPLVVDVTDAVTPGATATLSYRGLLGGAERTVEGTDAWIDLTSWIVFSK